MFLYRVLLRRNLLYFGGSQSGMQHKMGFKAIDFVVRHGCQSPTGAPQTTESPDKEMNGFNEESYDVSFE